MAGRGIYVESSIRAPLAEVWARTQDLEDHPRWDLRFSSIEPTTLDDEAQRFRYARRIPWRTVQGVGISIGERAGADGSRTSALRFATDDPLSPIRSGRGYWRYVPDGDSVRFITGYDFEPGMGRVVDLVARPLLGWATAWSFDRLRIWLERGEAPERWPLRSVLWIWRPERPRAARCLRAPASGRHRDDPLRDAPSTLGRLPDPHGSGRHGSGRHGSGPRR
ncbi:SRPBCC family protein [Agrococcus terreus]|uniref:SRPBCC family protein n=1 Tax=Agrococcus terreus TaxID=574649 RepID=UPI00384DD43E